MGSSNGLNTPSENCRLVQGSGAGRPRTDPGADPLKAAAGRRIRGRPLLRGTLYRRALLQPLSLGFKGQRLFFMAYGAKRATFAHGGACGSCLTGCGSRIPLRALGRRSRSATAAPAPPCCIRRRRRAAPQPFGFPFDKIYPKTAHSPQWASHTILG